MNKQNLLHGIDKLGFYTPQYCLDLHLLAKKRGIDPEKFYTGLGQHKMSLPAPGEDIITMGANAAHEILTDTDKQQIDTVIFATEGGVDLSKSAASFILSLLELSNHCRIMEIKHACYAATAALQTGLALLNSNPKRKILVIAADVAKYALNSAAESSQGAGAIALLMTVNPQIIALEPESGFYAEDSWDFWRPTYMSTAIVDGHSSIDSYLRILEKCWQHYTQLSGRGYNDHDCFCYHMPVPKLVEKAHKKLARINDIKLSNEAIREALEPMLNYGREAGNCYTAALYIGLLSLLENTTCDMTSKRIGIYSYGSGAAGEFFSGIIQPAYKRALNIEAHKHLLNNRQQLSYEEYEKFYHFSLPTDGSKLSIPKYNTGAFRLAEIENHKRKYKKEL